jgi:hypothetical protein
MFTTTLPPRKTRREILNDIKVELAIPEECPSWDSMIGRRPRSHKLFTDNIPSEEFVYTLEKLGRLSTWDTFMGRTELKLGY